MMTKDKTLFQCSYAGNSLKAGLWKYKTLLALRDKIHIFLCATTKLFNTRGEGSPNYSVNSRWAVRRTKGSWCITMRMGDCTLGESGVKKCPFPPELLSPVQREPLTFFYRSIHSNWLIMRIAWSMPSNAGVKRCFIISLVFCNSCRREG